MNSPVDPGMSSLPVLESERDDTRLAALENETPDAFVASRRQSCMSRVIYHAQRRELDASRVFLPSHWRMRNKLNIVTWPLKAQCTLTRPNGPPLTMLILSCRSVPTAPLSRPQTTLPDKAENTPNFIRLQEPVISASVCEHTLCPAAETLEICASARETEMERCRGYVV